jgi:hypothetical protein
LSALIGAFNQKPDFPNLITFVVSQKRQFWKPNQLQTFSWFSSLNNGKKIKNFC